ncbi:TIGR00266 family protein [Thermoflavimicrobium dichotomicum]|uniref:TIGR00266 family protein n=1 Tax=Thermoflavimicrobium dichotomicum TaxID=46223 RepID=A0A1I3LTX2_9BACL|nr:TIGR00266 family protein [Thermoflavimicrobium dichotomicum]SFI88103.1 TIGR00266 family protein [Thermoflavimicrobium dichotomicum]
MKNAHEIDFRIYGEDMQFVEIELDPGESVIAEAGSLMMMENDIQMETIFGDGSQASSGLFGKLFSAGKRLLSGEGLFMTLFTNTAIQGKRHVSFAAPYPGKIVPMDLAELGGKIICQKDAFLCAAKGVSVGIEFQQKMARKFFTGKSFILQKLEGDGLAFIHSGGTIYKKVLFPDEIIRVDSGCLVAMTRNVQYQTEFVGDVKTALFGGEGLFFTTLRGPGTVWIQSLPFNRLVSRIFAQAAGEDGEKSSGSGIGGIIGEILD